MAHYTVEKGKVLHLLPPATPSSQKISDGAREGRKAPKDGGIKESERRLLYARWIQAARIKSQKERSSKLMSIAQSVGYCNSKDGTEDHPIRFKEGGGYVEQSEYLPLSRWARKSEVELSSDDADWSDEKSTCNGAR